MVLHELYYNVYSCLNWQNVRVRSGFYELIHDGKQAPVVVDDDLQLILATDRAETALWQLISLPEGFILKSPHTGCYIQHVRCNRLRATGELHEAEVFIAERCVGGIKLRSKIRPYLRLTSQFNALWLSESKGAIWRLKYHGMSTEEKAEVMILAFTLACILVKVFRRNI